MNPKVNRPSIVPIIVIPFFVLFMITNIRAQSYVDLYQKGIGRNHIDILIHGDKSEDGFYTFRLEGMNSVCIDSLSNIFVLDEKFHGIRKFDRDGRYRQSYLGRENPLSMTSMMIIDDEDNLIIYDRDKQAFLRVNTHGNIIETIPRPSSLGDRSRRISMMKACPGNRLYVETRGVAPDEENEGPDIREKIKRKPDQKEQDFNLEKKEKKEETAEERETDDRVEILVEISRISRDFKSKTMMRAKRFLESRAGPAGVFFPIPFHPFYAWDVTPDGRLIVGDSENGEIDVYSSEGESIKKIHFRGKRMRVTDNDKSDYIVRLKKGSSPSTGGGTEKSEFILKNIQFPRYKPWFRGLITDHEGYLLVCRYEKEGRYFLYDVYSPDYEYLNTVKLPDLIEPRAAIKEGTIYQIVRTSVGMHCIYRYTLM